MKPRLILHIGANKTGSTAVQTFLRLNWKVLLSLGFLVPDRELGASENISGDHLSVLQKLIDDSDHAGLDAKINLLMQAKAQVVVISAENLSNGLNYKFFSRILPGIDCKVVLY